jgi:tRNA modification GTPase
MEHCFRPARGGTVAERRERTIIFGTWCHGEELVVARVAPDVFEVHCHGGDTASAAIIATLTAEGALHTPWEAFLHRIEPDLIAAEALLALAHATTLRGAEHLLAQYHGALRNEIGQCAALLDRGASSEATSRVTRLLKLAPVGEHCTLPWRVVLAGAPNVGKSSLLNALLGYQRALVFPQPGTTRDLVTATTACDSWPVELIDMAGLREADEPLERAGIALARQELATADLVLLVGRATEPWPEAYRQWQASWSPASPVLPVVNQCDLAPRGPEHPADAIATSAVTGEGIDTLLSAIAARLVPDPPALQEAVPFTARQRELLSTVQEALQGDNLAEARRALRLVLG